MRKRIDQITFIRYRSGFLVSIKVPQSDYRSDCDVEGTVRETAVGKGCFKQIGCFPGDFDRISAAVIDLPHIAALLCAGEQFLIGCKTGKTLLKRGSIFSAIKRD